jgi:type II secretory pathway component PulF
MTPSGMIVSNTIEESSKYLAIKKLKRNNLIPIDVAKSLQRTKSKRTVRKNTRGIDEVLKDVDTANLLLSRQNTKQSYFDKVYHSILKSDRITSRDIIVFTQNFYLLKKANFNNIHALNTIIESTDNFSFRGVLEDILAGVEAGENMYSTMEYYEDIFPYLYINMVKVGELSGNLTRALEQALKFLEDSESINKTLRGILIPNLIQFALLFVMLIVGTLVALPTIQGLYESMGSQEELPAISQWFSGVIDWILTYWYIPTAFIGGIIALITWYINTPKGKYNFHYFKYTMPIFGQLVFAIDFSRVMRAMLLNLNNGMRIQEALEVGKNVSKNLVMLSIMEASINNILIGQSWIEPFERSKLATPMMTEMLKIGMNTDLAQMMEKLVEYMDIDINNLLDKTIKVLPQLVYAIVGVLLIFFVLVVLVPCINVYMGGWMISAYGLG